MNSGIYTAYSGMKAQSEALEIMANNLANINTAAFKEEKTFYSYLNQAKEATGDSGDLSSVINRSIRVDSVVNPQPGTIAETNRDLDIAIEGNGFLMVDAPQGTRYTRNGSLHLNIKHELVNSDGFPVVGTNSRRITLGPGIVSIGEHGEIFMGNNQVDSLKITTFDNLSALKKEGNSLFLCPPGRAVEKPSDAKIRSGCLEQSNVNPVSSIVRMVEIMRHFEAIQKSVSLVMNDINSKAIEKLGR
jgi:flagellar basal-body rod protein FlgG